MAQDVTGLVRISGYESMNFELYCKPCHLKLFQAKSDAVQEALALSKVLHVLFDNKTDRTLRIPVENALEKAMRRIQRLNRQITRERAFTTVVYKKEQ